MSSLSLPPALIVFLAAMLPLVEARYAIILARCLDMAFAEAFVLAVLGNLVSTIPFYVLLGPAARWGRRWRPSAAAIDWLLGRARRRKDLVDRYGAFGLTLFIGAPLPMTGSWTGAAVAFVVGMRFWPTAVSMTLGVIAAAVIIGLPTYLGAMAWQALGR